MKLYGSFEKIEEKDDGTLVVDGYASSEAVDSDGEIVKASAIADALPDYMKFGAVREMHQKLAAGTAIHAAVGEDGRTYFSAHIVDPLACKKVQTRVYKGFSIGGDITKRDTANPKTITGIRLTEISLVDRPANPEATFSMYKADVLDETEEVATVTEIAVDQGSVAKSMYDVASLAMALNSLAGVISDSAWEAKWEGDNSELPAKLRACLAELSPLLAVMAAEESAELVAGTQPPEVADVEPVVEVIVLGEKTTGLAKKGARNSKADMDKLQAIHDHSASMGADCSASKADVTGDLAKANLEKLSTERDEAIAKVAALESERETLKKRVQELEAEPAAPKGALMAVSKTDDVTDLEKKDETKIEATDDPLTRMRKVHAGGGVRITKF